MESWADGNILKLGFYLSKVIGLHVCQNYQTPKRSKVINVYYSSITLTLKIRNGHEIEGKPTKCGVVKVKQRKFSKNRGLHRLFHMLLKGQVRGKEKSDLGG